MVILEKDRLREPSMKVASTTENKIVHCVDEGLQIFGEAAKEAIYFYLKRNFQLRKTEIPEEPETFCKAITSLFGEDGAKPIEESILQKTRLCFKLKHRSRSTFVKTVLNLKAKQSKVS
jgi:hypothetical protein